MQKLRRKLQRSQVVQAQRFTRWRKHPFGIPIAVFLGLLLVSGVVLLILSATHTTSTFHPDSSYIVIINHDHATQIVPTKERTVGALLKKLDIHIAARDRVEPSLDTQIVQDNFRINVYRAVPVTVTDGTTTVTTYSAAATARGVAASTGMSLYAEDNVIAQPAVNLILQQSVGEQVTINRSIPLTLNVYGTVLSLRTHEKTVGALLDAKNIKLGKADTVIPARDTPVTSAMQVFVNRKGTQIVTVTQQIPIPIQTVTDTSLSFGTTAIRQQGSAGTQVLTYQIHTQNGVETSRTLLQTVVTVQPVTQIVARGLAVSIPADKQAVMAQAGIASSDYAYVDYIMSHEGGWCPTKVQGEHTCPGYPPDTIPSNLGYGIGQATPGTKMSGFGADWKTNVVTQLKWATSYADGRYGSWGAAYNHWESNHNW